MNKTKIDWANYTWNPITGCKHGCPYCYARKLTALYKEVFPHGFEPHFYVSRLDEPLHVKKPARIFTVSMGDMFGEWVPNEWIHSVFDVMAAAEYHRFIILTKNPARIERALYGQDGEWYLGGGDYYDHIWLGVTVEQEGIENRIKVLQDAKDLESWHKFVSFEPLLGPVHPNLSGIEWVIIGAQTNPDKQPDQGWIVPIIDEANRNMIPVFEKSNLEQAFRKEYPKGLIV
jgi:protein gp37